MTILVAIATLLLFAPYSQTNPTPGENNKGPDYKNAATRKESPHKSAETGPLNAPPNAQTSENDRTENNRNSQERVYLVDIKSEPTSNWTIAYVLINSGLFGIGATTLFMLHKQIQATHNAERGRIDIIFEYDADDPGSIQRFEFNANNSGRSEVRIVDWVLYHHVAERNGAYKRPNRRTKPIFSEFRNALLHKQQGSQMKSLAAMTVFSKEEREGDKIGYVTGVVNYIDIFQKKHRTRVTYMFDSGALIFLPEHVTYT